MISVKINGITIRVEQGTEFIDDNTEEYDLGKLLIVNSTKDTPYTDYADVELTILGEVLEGVIESDLVARTSVGKYSHTITIVEPVVKLAEYIIPDRKFDTVDGAKTTYEYHLDTMLLTLRYNKTQPFTVATATRTLLEEVADEKEYYGGSLLNNLTDMFRQVNARPTLSLDNEIGHQALNELGNEIEFTRIDGKLIDSKISDYASKVHNKLKNATYEADLISGGTYFPAKGYGVTPRVAETEEKFLDTNAKWIIDSDIRRMIQTRAIGITIQDDSIINLQMNVVSKDEWDQLLIETDRAVVYQGDYKNNTLYFVGNTIVNAGDEYEYESLTVPVISNKVFFNAIARALYVQTGDAQDLKSPTNMIDFELEFYYQPERDLEVRQERHELSRVDKETTLLNQQKDSQLELARMGRANKSLINRVGNDTFEITVRYFERNSPILFKNNDYTDEGYRIIKRQLLVRDSSIDVTYKLTKNQSTLNPITAVNQSLSPYTISKRNVLTNFIYEEYIEFSSTEKTDTTQNSQNMRPILLNTLDFSSTYDTPIYYGLFRRDTETTYIAKSVHNFPMGNSFQFNIKFQSPNVAGYKLESDAIGNKVTAVAYTDEYGQVDYATSYFYNALSVNADSHPERTYDGNYLLRVPYQQVLLQPNEIFAMTYSLHCISDDENLIVGDYFLENNSLIKELGVNQTYEVVYYDDNPRYTIYDNYKKSGSNGTGSYFVTTGFDAIVLSGTTNKSWAICKTGTDAGRVVLAYNYTGTNLNTVYLNLLKDRPNINIL